MPASVAHVVEEEEVSVGEASGTTGLVAERNATSATVLVTMHASARWTLTAATSATRWGTLPKNATRKSTQVHATTAE